MKHTNLMVIMILVIMAFLSSALNAQYFKTATVNSLSGAGNDYQIRLTVHYGAGSDAGDNVYLNSNCKTDFGDVRFFEGSNELSYWMESKTDGVSAIFWVKLVGDLSSGNLSLTIKYGNANATTASNGDDTFIFFDDFSGDLSKWTVHKEPTVGAISIPSGQDYVRCGGGFTSFPHGHTVLGSSPAYTDFQDNAIEYRYRLSTNGIAEVSFRGDYAANTGYKARSDQRTTSGGKQSFLTPPYSVGLWLLLSDATEQGLAPAADTWYRATVTAYGPNFAMYINDVLQCDTVLGTDLQAGEISLQNHYGNYSDFDWVGVRKFANDTPSITDWTAETLPVELSSFTVTISAYHNVVLTWITQSESGVMGFYVYRNTDPILANAQQISPLINASNTANQQIYVYTDDEVNQIGTYYYWLMAADMDGSERFHGPINVTYESPQPGSPGIPLFTGLNQIYPNPFNPSANIRYELAKPSDVLITIFNMRGQAVRSFNRNNVAAGSWELVWDGKDQNGSGLPSGVYYIRMQAGQDSSMKKAVLMK